MVYQVMITPKESIIHQVMITHKEEIIKFAMNFAITGSNRLLDLKKEAERIEKEILKM